MTILRNMLIGVAAMILATATAAWAAATAHMAPDRRTIYTHRSVRETSRTTTSRLRALPHR